MGRDVHLQHSRYLHVPLRPALVHDGDDRRSDQLHNDHDAPNHPLDHDHHHASGHPSSPLAGAAASAISIPAHERGIAVNGLVKISAAGADGRLEVDLFASAPSLQARVGGLASVGHLLASVGHLLLASVGHLIRTGLHRGTVRFTAPLNPTARRALRRHGQLIVTVVLSVRSPHSTAASETRRVLLSP